MFNWKKAVATVAPYLGAAIGGPAGGLAGKVIASALGLPDDAKEKDIAKAIEKDPEALLKLQKGEQEFLLRLEELDIDKEKIAANDRQDARDYNSKAGTSTVNRLALFVVGLVVVICVGVGYLFAADKLTALTAIQASILTLVLREGFAKLEQVCNYFFGSSHGSRQKDEMRSK